MLTLERTKNMNQKEEIGKIEKELEEKKTEFKQLKTELDEKYSDAIQAINKARRKRSKLFNEIYSISMEKVKIFSNSPTQYIDGSSHEINSDIVKKIRQIEEETGQDIFSKSTGYIWQDIYHTIIRKVPRIKKLEKEIDKVEEQLEKCRSEGFEDLQEKIEAVNSRILWLEKRITRLSDISYFRQWAKDVKNCENRKKEEEKETRAFELFKTYFKKEFLPKIIED